MTVPAASIACMVLAMLAGILIPVGMVVYLRRKYRAPMLPFAVGIGVMVVFAFVLESILHNIVLSSPAGALIQGNIWLYALYGGAAAALFEEIGRYIGIKLLLKKHHGNDAAALMYGAGHGGIEAFVLLTIGMVGNLSLALMINGGMADLSSVPGMQEAAEVLCTTTPGMFLAGIVERLPAVLAQIAMSILVWKAAAKPGCGKLLWVSVGFHFFLDASAAIINSFGSVIFTELWIIAVSVAFFLWARKKLDL